MNDSKDRPKSDSLSCVRRYKAVVPDTLDLGERARVAVNALTGLLDPEHRYQPWHQIYLVTRPPFMTHLGNGICNWGKILEALLEMRLMSGSEQNSDVDSASLRGMISYIEDDLYYTTGEGRPWHKKSWFGHVTEDYVDLNSQARAILALIANHQIDGNPEWKKVAGGLADGLAKLAVQRDDYAYYPDNPEVHMGGSIGYPRSGWKTQEEPPAWPQMGHTWPSIFTHGAAIRALSQWAELDGDENALEMARGLAAFVMKPKHWAAEAEPKAVVGWQHAHFGGHIHSVTAALMGLLKLASLTSDDRMKQFVRDGYEYIRNFGIARMGLFGETCEVGDMAVLAIGLSDAGIGDYWDDVDQSVRNHMTEVQLLDADTLRTISQAGPEHELNPLWETNDRVIEHMIGGLITDATHLTKLEPYCCICCQGNGFPAYYRIWEGIVRCDAGVAQVNLLLNRASPWLDIDSYLPYEGKVRVRNKLARALYLRMPSWVARASVRTAVNGQAREPLWVANRLVFGDLHPGDVIEVVFPMVQTTETYCNGWEGVRNHDPIGAIWHAEVTSPQAWEQPSNLTPYELDIRGNTVIDVSPRDPEWEGARYPGYPIYLRDHMKSDKAPMAKVTRYVAPALIKW